MNDDSLKTVKLVDDYFQESAKYIQTFESEWQEYERFYNKKHWKFSDGKRPVKNFIFSTIESEVPILTDSRPAADVVPVEDSDEAFQRAKMLSSALQWVFDQQNLQLKNSEITRQHLKTGTGWFYVDYDPDLSNGQGDVTLKILPWRYCFPDPNATNIDDAMYFGIKMPMRLMDIKRKFPAFADQLKGETLSLSQDRNNIQGFIRPDRWDGVGGYEGEGQSNFKLDDMVLYEEMWHKDYAMEPVDPEETLEEIAKEFEQMMAGQVPDITQYEDHAAHKEAHEEAKMILVSQALQIPVEAVTEQDIEAVKQDPILGVLLTIIEDHIAAHDEYEKINPDGEKPKYPMNLRLTIKVGKIVLYDDAAPVEDGLIPVAPAYCYKDSDSIFGTGEIKNIIDSQKAYNEMDWHELQGLALNSNQPWLVDNEANVDADNLTNDPGLVITKSKDGDVRRMEVGQVSPQLATRKFEEQQTIQAISGVSESTQGRRPTGITAASAIKYLQEASVGRIRLKGRNFEEYTLPRTARLILSRVVKYYNSERMLRIYDDNGKIQFIKYDPKEVENFKYDVRIVPGSSVGYDKETVFQLFSGLVEKGIMSAKTLIQVSDLPYRTKILEEIEANDQKDLMIQQLQAQLLQFQQLLTPESKDQPA